MRQPRRCRRQRPLAAPPRALAVTALGDADPEQRRWSAARAAARSAPSSEPRLERLLGLATRLLGLLEVDLATPCRPSRPSPRPCPAGPGGSRRRSRTTPPRRPCGSAARRPRASRPAARGAAGRRARPRCRAATTASTVVLVGEPLRRDDLELEGHRRLSLASFSAFSRTSSIVPARKNACSGSVSALPSRISLKRRDRVLDRRRTCRAGR